MHTYMSKTSGALAMTKRMVRIENMHGHIFPVEIGNRFSYEALYQDMSQTSSDQYSERRSCEVTKRYDASVFHPKLAGQAYLLICDAQIAYRERTKPASGAHEWGSVYFDKLGIWIDADPIKPREKKEPNNDGDYTLKSFELAR